MIEVGTRVVVKDTPYLRQQRLKFVFAGRIETESLCGKVGVVISELTQGDYAVDFGEHFMGHTCFGRCPTRTGRWLSADDIEPIDESLAIVEIDELLAIL